VPVHNVSQQKANGSMHTWWGWEAPHWLDWEARGWAGWEAMEREAAAVAAREAPGWGQAAAAWGCNCNSHLAIAIIGIMPEANLADAGLRNRQQPCSPGAQHTPGGCWRGPGRRLLGRGGRGQGHSSDRHIGNSRAGVSASQPHYASAVLQGLCKADGCRRLANSIADEG
jgi:hypothetical protein